MDQNFKHSTDIIEPLNGSLFVQVVYFLKNNKADRCSELIENTLSTFLKRGCNMNITVDYHYMTWITSPIPSVTSVVKKDAVSPNIKAMEERYQRTWDFHVMAHY